MNNRERAMAVLHYQEYDRLPVVHFGFWTDTLVKWASEGHITEQEAALWGANLQRAALWDANLRGAKLGGTRLKGAWANTNTIWPEGFEIPEGVTIENEQAGQ